MKNSTVIGDYLVIAITAILFITSIFVNGLSHDLLLETGVLMVSIKLIMMNRKNANMEKEILKELNHIKLILNKTFTSKND